jgi:hypothetical protein
MDDAKRADLEAKWKQVVTQAVTDDAFKKKLCRDPLAVLKEAGLTLPPEIPAKPGPDNSVQLILPKEVPENLAQEVKWWKWRLEMIHEFGREKNKKDSPVAPEHDD